MSSSASMTSIHMSPLAMGVFFAFFDDVVSDASPVPAAWASRPWGRSSPNHSSKGRLNFSGHVIT